MAGEKAEIIALLRELVELSALDEGSPQSFRVRAYENAIHGLEGRGDEIATMSRAELQKIPGVGKSTADKIREYLDTGSMGKLDKLRKKFPPAFVLLSRIPGLGPKSLLRLRAELGIENVDDLRAAIASQEIRGLSGFGKKTEENLAKAIERLGMTGKEQRTPIADAMPLAERLVQALAALPEVEEARYCGSLRRFSETIGDIDIVVATRPGHDDGAATIMEFFATMPQVADIVARGDKKTSILTAAGLQVDLRVVTPDEFGAAILYFTGSKAHNIKLRQRALDRGYTLNEYALTDKDTDEVIAARTEEEIYKALDLSWVPEPMREDTGEVELAEAGELPERLTEDALIGDLHVHTTYSGDGRSPIGDIVARAHGRGYRYLAITDHGEDLAINGVSRERLTEQADELAALQETYPRMHLMRGCELNIGPDGGLDYDLEFRMGLDWCVAAVHSHFDLPQARQTERVIRAMHDPSVDVIGHLSGRYIGRRPGIELDIDAVLEAAVETDTAIELNSALKRLDVSASVLRRARERGVKLIINTDAHHVDELARMRWGVLQATRGWVIKDNVVNTWSWRRFKTWKQARRRS